MDKLRRRAESSRYTLVLQDFETVRFMGVRGDFSVSKELPPGRGFMVKAVQASMVQICLPSVEGLDGSGPDTQLSGLIADIRKKYRKRAQWSYKAEDLGPLEAALGVEITVSPSAPLQSDTLSELSEIMAMQAELAEQMASTELPEPSDFSSVEVPAEEPSSKRKSTTRKKTAGTAKKKK